MDVKDPMAASLFLAAKGAIQAAGGAAPMLLGAKEGKERVVLLLPNREGMEDALLQYIQALTIVLFSGVDAIYELRDVFFSQKEEVGEQTPTPREDPEAENGLLVVRTEPEGGGEASWLWPYGIGDDGRAVWDRPVQASGKGLDGVYVDAMHGVIDQWLSSGKPLASDEELESMRAKVGLMGRLKQVDAE